MGIPFWFMFALVFFPVRWFVLRDRYHLCKCRKKDNTKLLSIPNLLAVMAAMAVTAVTIH